MIEESVRMQKVNRLLQKVLGDIFTQRAHTLVGVNVLATVTDVRISPDLNHAKVYLSFVTNIPIDSTLEKLKQKKGLVRRLLGSAVGNKLRRTPDLQFYIDNSAAQALKMHRLLDNLEHPEAQALS